MGQYTTFLVATLSCDMFWLHCLLLGSALSVELDAGLSIEQLGQYHQRVGIPLAEAVRNAELAGSNTITNGSSLLGAFPFVGNIIIQLRSGSTSMCTGSLLSAIRIVTAAHCAMDAQNRARNFTVVFGSMKLYSGGIRLATNKTVLHENYNKNTLDNDIALIYIPPVTFNAVMAPISLPQGSLLQSNFSGLSAQAIGFRLTEDDGLFLNNVTLEVISNELCGRTYSNMIEAKLCASGANGSICFGDSGGPLVITNDGKQVLIGVLSSVSKLGCQSEQPAVFTRVTDFVPWIESNL